MEVLQRLAQYVIRAGTGHQVKNRWVMKNAFGAQLVNSQ
jgi:hypothetical protein